KKKTTRIHHCAGLRFASVGMTKLGGSPESQDSLEETFPQDAELLPSAQRDFRGENVVLLFGDSFEQAAVDRDERPQSRLAVFGDVADQFLAGRVILAGAIGFQRQQGTEAGSVGILKQLGN